MKTNPEQSPRWFYLRLLLICGSLLAAFTCHAQQPTSPRKLRVVDEVALRGQGKMLGIITKYSPNSSTEMLVERSWFQTTYPKRYALHLRQEVEDQKKVKEELLARLEQWKTKRTEVSDERLIQFIDSEITRLSEPAPQNSEDEEASVASKQFTWLHFPADEVRRVFPQSAVRHRVANLAWAHEVQGVSIRSVAALTKALEKLGIKSDADAVDLSSECPTKRQSDEEWNARICICEFAFRKRLHFQGTGKMLKRIDPNAPANQQDLVELMLQGGGMQSLMENLLGNQSPKAGNGRSPIKKETWWTSATDEAERAGCRSVRISRLLQDLTNPIVKVEEHFLAEISPGKWQSIFTSTAESNRDKIAKGGADFLKQDPQIQKITGAINALGANNQALLDKALRQGLATQRAMEAAGGPLIDFVDEFSERVDGPALILK